MQWLRAGLSSFGVPAFGLVVAIFGLTFVAAWPATSSRRRRWYLSLMVLGLIGAVVLASGSLFKAVIDDDRAGAAGPRGAQSRRVTERSSNVVPGLLFAVTGAIAFSGKAIIVKLAYRHGVDAVTLIMLRMVFALPIFAAMAWWASRGKARLQAREWAGVAGLGVLGYYLSSFLDFAGLQFISASLERLILYLNPTLVLGLGWVLYRKPIRRMQVAGMAISYSGVLLVFGHEVGVFGPGAAWGTMLVFASAITYAVYLVYSGQMVQRLGSLRLVGLATSVACLCCIAQFAVLRPLSTAFDVAPAVVWLSVLNATLCTAVPVLLVMMAIERIGPALSAQTGMVGPLSTILMGVLILGEPFTAWIAAGTMLVIAGIYVFTRARPAQEPARQANEPGPGVAQPPRV